MSIVVLMGRIFFSWLFLSSSIGHLTNPGMVVYAASQGVPFPEFLVPATGVMILVGGLSILLGFKARWGAWLIVGFLIPTTLMMHRFWIAVNPQMAMMQTVEFYSNIALLGGALMIVWFGSNGLSIKDPINFLPFNWPVWEALRASVFAKIMVLAGRLCFSWIFITSGLIQLFNLQGIIAYGASKGMPMPEVMIPAGCILMIVSGLSILLGFKARWGAWGIALFLLTATGVFHRFWDIPDAGARMMEMVRFSKNTSLLGAALMLAVFGSGPWSVKE